MEDFEESLPWDMPMFSGGSSLFLLSFSLSFPFPFSEGPGAEVFRAKNASFALAYFSARESISKKLVENFFSRLNKNLKGLRAPFMVDMATI